jgi:hypothetical protein
MFENLKEDGYGLSAATVPKFTWKDRKKNKRKSSITIFELDTT